MPIAAIHLLAYSLTYGSNVFHSYVNAPLLFKNLSRDDFSKITALILPKYFIAQSLLPLGLALTIPFKANKALTKWSYITLGLASACQLLNVFWLGPAVQGLKVQRKKLENQIKTSDGDVKSELEAQLKVKTKQFGKLHGISLLTNLVSSIALTGYGVVLSKGLVWL